MNGAETLGTHRIWVKLTRKPASGGWRSPGIALWALNVVHLSPVAISVPHRGATVYPYIAYIDRECLELSPGSASGATKELRSSYAGNLIGSEASL